MRAGASRLTGPPGARPSPHKMPPDTGSFEMDMPEGGTDRAVALLAPIMTGRVEQEADAVPAWIAGILLVFATLSVRLYRRAV